jgi:hypothetical protein
MALRNCEFARKLHDLLADASEGVTLEPWQCWIDTFVFESPMSLSIQQEELCRRLEGELLDRNDARAAAAPLRQFATEIDELWDRLSRVDAIVRGETPDDPIQRRLNNFALALINRNELKARKARRRPLLARIG